MPRRLTSLLVVLVVGISAACGGASSDRASSERSTTTDAASVETDGEGTPSPKPGSDGGEAPAANTATLPQATGGRFTLEAWCYRDLDPAEGLGEGFHMHGTFTNGSTFAVTVAEGKVELFVLTDRTGGEPVRYEHQRSGFRAVLDGSELVLDAIPVVGPDGRDTVSFRVDAERPPLGQCEGTASG